MRFLITGFVLLNITLVSFSQYYEPPEEDKKIKITGHPILMYTPETSWVFGAAGILLINTYDSTSMFQTPSIVNPFFFFTLNNQFWAVTRAEIYNDNRVTNIRFEAGKIPEYYYGLGMNTTSENYKYTLQTFGGKYEYLTYVNRRNVIGISTQLNYVKIADIEPGPLLDENIKGITPGFSGGIGPSYLFDTRNSVIYPRKGWYLKSTLMYLPPLFKGNYTYTSIDFDARKYLSTANRKNTFALQIVNKYLLGSNIPFYQLNRLGGEPRLRGIHANRHINNNLLFGQVEYRRELPFIFGLVAFAGTGRVYENFGEFKLNEFAYTYGAGLRIELIPEEEVNFRIDVGFGSNGENGVYVGIQEVF